MRLEIQKSAFVRLVQQILTDVSGRNYFRLSQEAMEVLHREMEAYAVDMFTVQKELAFLFGQETLQIEHFRAYLLVKHT